MIQDPFKKYADATRTKQEAAFLRGDFYVIFQSGFYFFYSCERGFGRWFTPNKLMEDRKVHQIELYLEAIQTGEARISIAPPS
jgi:hypothetical protein